MTRRRALHVSPFKSPVAALLEDDAPPSTSAAPDQPSEEAAEDDDDAEPQDGAGADADTHVRDLPDRTRARRRIPVNRTGTRTAPYERKDGVATVKIAFSASAEFEARLRMFVAGLPPGTSRNQWLEQALTKAIAKEEKHR